VLPKEEGVGEHSLQESLEVEREEGQTEEHAQEDQEEDAEDKRKVEGQHGKRQEIVDAQTVSH
jgi:hypothetical protein